ncbi:hypothetical protein TREES_T100001737 [Tupaia chinensis]|uniref:Uncharacterized protein n=1 Tax=Tupaia chinensis TaxID=246437 RepID=L9KKE5_TUPCH|nr:hypothetical protein TREES_T100001737 [Tupaia chinensis]
MMGALDRLLVSMSQMIKSNPREANQLANQFSPCIDGFATMAPLIVPGTYVLVTSETCRWLPVHTHFQNATGQTGHRVLDPGQTAFLSLILMSSDATFSAMTTLACVFRFSH